MKTFKSMMKTLAVAAFAASFSHAQAPVPNSGSKALQRPNFVYILTDDLGCGDVACMNPQSKIKTPQLDRLASQGMEFTEAHSSSAVCSPSRYSILTGRYNWRSSLKRDVLYGFSQPIIEKDRLTVAGMLHGEGYDTAYVGKWHLGLDWALLPGAAMDMGIDKNGVEHNHHNDGKGIDFSKPIGRSPVTLGFDAFFGITSSLDMPPYVYLENDRVTTMPTEQGSMADIRGKHTRIGPIAPGFAAVDVLPTFTQRAVNYIDDHAAGSRDGKPFFLYLALPTPHTPLAPTPEWTGKSGLNYYADYVMESDDCIGKVLAALDRDGLAENTVVVFTSDNGCSPEADIPYLVSHGHDPSAGRRGYKADIYDGGHRIPLIVRWPGHVEAGAKTSGFVCLGDFMATSADILDAKIPDTAAEDSISFLPLMAGKSEGLRDTLVESSIDGSFAIRQGQWKLAFCPDSGGWSYPRPGRDKTDGLPRFQLFDLAADPAEKTNVMEKHPEIVQRLGRLMREYIENGRSTPGAPQKNFAVEDWHQTAWMGEFK